MQRALTRLCCIPEQYFLRKTGQNLFLSKRMSNLYARCGPPPCQFLSVCSLMNEREFFINSFPPTCIGPCSVENEFVAYLTIFSQYILLFFFCSNFSPLVFFYAVPFVFFLCCVLSLVLEPTSAR